MSLLKAASHKTGLFNMDCTINNLVNNKNKWSKEKYICQSIRFVSFDHKHDSAFESITYPLVVWHSQRTEEVCHRCWAITLHIFTFCVPHYISKKILSALISTLMLLISSDRQLNTKGTQRSSPSSALAARSSGMLLEADDDTSQRRRSDRIARFPRR